MRSLVTGASGLLGLNLALEASQQHVVFGTVKDHALRTEAFSVHRVDLRAPGAIEHLLDQTQPDWVIHCAALALVDALPAEGSSQGRMNLFDMAQVARIGIDSIGSDFDTYIANLESDAHAKGIEVFQVWLPLASPFASAATDILRRHGYFLGGMLPCWPTGDGLLMQKVSQDPDWAGMLLYSERAQTIAEMVRRDWKRVTQG